MKTTSSRFPLASPFIVGALLMGAASCTVTNDEDKDGDGDPDVTETSKVSSALTADGGEQDSGLTGRGAISSSSKAELARYEDDGSTTVVDEADIDASGNFSFDVAATGDVLVISTFNAEGSLIGQALVERGPDANEEIRSQAVTTESTIEAMIYTQLREDGHDDVSASDLRLRLDLDSALVIARNDASELNADIAASASVVLAAQESRLRYYGERSIDAAVVARAHADAFVVYNKAVAENAANEGAAMTTLLAAQLQADIAAGISQWDGARLESEASASARVVLEGRNDIAEELRTSMTRASAVIEARVVADAFVAVVTETEGRAENDIDDANDAASELELEVAAAATVTAINEAFVDFRNDVRGDGDDVEVDNDGILGLLDIEGVLDATAALLVVVQVGDDLSAELGLVADANVDGNTADEEAVAADVAEAYTAFRTDLEASLNANFDVSDDDITLMTRVLVLTEGSFR